jgi:hypothetical protein
MAKKHICFVTIWSNIPILMCKKQNHDVKKAMARETRREIGIVHILRQQILGHFYPPPPPCQHGNDEGQEYLTAING